MLSPGGSPSPAGLRLTTALLLLPGVAACSWESPIRAHETLESVQALMAAQRYDQALAALRASKAARPPQGQPRLAIWKPWDRAVYRMEEGLLALLAGRPDEALAALQRAERSVTASTTRSIRRTHNSVRGGAYEDDYRPPGYERLLLHDLLVLCHLARGDVEAAAVAARRAREAARFLARGGDELRLELDKNATYVQWVTSKAELIGIDVARRRARRQWHELGFSLERTWASALSHWLDGVTHAILGDPSAAVAYRRALAAARDPDLPLDGAALAWLRADVGRAGAVGQPATSLPAASLPAASLPAADQPAASLPAADQPAASLPAASLPAALPAVVEPQGQVIVVHLRGRGPRLGLRRSELDLAPPGPALEVRVVAAGKLATPPPPPSVPLRTLVEINGLAALRDSHRRSLIDWRVAMRAQLGEGNIGQESRSWRTLPARIDVGRLWLPEGPAVVELRAASGQPVLSQRVLVKRGAPALVLVQRF